MRPQLLNSSDRANQPSDHSDHEGCQGDRQVNDRPVAGVTIYESQKDYEQYGWHDREPRDNQRLRLRGSASQRDLT
jgi:hypothetical protein